jgi:hyperosmotically inducible protein
MNQPYKRSLVLLGVLLLGVAGCAHTGEKSGAYGDDSLITTKVKFDMAADKDISARNIVVNTSRGVVTLTGTAVTDHESREAADIARHVAGVVSVINEIHVQAGDRVGAYVDDSWITAKVKSEMAANNEISALNISVNTSKGVVTLSGTATTMKESAKAVEIARSVQGVVSVENAIRVL